MGRTLAPREPNPAVSDEARQDENLEGLRASDNLQEDPLRNSSASAHFPCLPGCILHLLLLKGARCLVRRILSSDTNHCAILSLCPYLSHSRPNPESGAEAVQSSNLVKAGPAAQV